MNSMIYPIKSIAISQYSPISTHRKSPEIPDLLVQVANGEDQGVVLVHLRVQCDAERLDADAPDAAQPGDAKDHRANGRGEARQKGENQQSLGIWIWGKNMGEKNMGNLGEKGMGKSIWFFMDFYPLFFSSMWLLFFPKKINPLGSEHGFGMMIKHKPWNDTLMWASRA